jgi:hypothetical protein
MTSTSIVRERLRELLEKLAGQKAPLDARLPDAALRLLDRGGAGLGYSQLNELLILLGFDRVTHSFFQFLADGSLEYKVEATISSMEALAQGVDRFRRIALLLYGNVKYAFKTLSRDAELLQSRVQWLSPIDLRQLRSRHEPIRPIDEIPGNLTYYLGYLIERDLHERLKVDPSDTKANEDEQIRKGVVAKGKANHEAYLASDHLDVYVATSMRERHEFAAVSRITREIFTHPELAELNLRWFDPTQAYCKDRIDKGLAEALMLRRADCTIYFAQESDTLGKDSELASTLAQGKPVIAFVPEVDEQYVIGLMAELRVSYPGEEDGPILLRQLRLFEPEAAWADPLVRNWIDEPSCIDIKSATERLQKKIAAHYNKRADTLKQSHPLGIQVNLATGVANGVLVVRNVSQCAELVRRIITRTLEFDLAENEGYVFLRERISGCVFRVMTGDTMLSNAFWNFYLEPAE